MLCFRCPRVFLSLAHKANAAHGALLEKKASVERDLEQQTEEERMLTVQLAAVSSGKAQLAEDIQSARVAVEETVELGSNSCLDASHVNHDDAASTEIPFGAAPEVYHAVKAMRGEVAAASVRLDGVEAEMGNLSQFTAETETALAASRASTQSLYAELLIAKAERILFHAETDGDGKDGRQTSAKGADFDAMFAGGNDGASNHRRDARATESLAAEGGTLHPVSQIPLKDGSTVLELEIQASNVSSATLEKQNTTYKAEQISDAIHTPTSASSEQETSTSERVEPTNPALAAHAEVTRLLRELEASQARLNEAEAETVLSRDARAAADLELAALKADRHEMEVALAEAQADRGGDGSGIERSALLAAAEASKAAALAAAVEDKEAALVAAGADKMAALESAREAAEAEKLTAIASALEENARSRDAAEADNLTIEASKAATFAAALEEKMAAPIAAEADKAAALDRARDPAETEDAEGGACTASAPASAEARNPDAPIVDLADTPSSMEITTEPPGDAAAAAEDGEAPLRDGFLRKRGFVNTAWKWRWMWIDGTHLRWARNKRQLREHGSIDLRGATVADDAHEEERGNAFVFEVIILAEHNAKVKGLHYQLQASSFGERERWKYALVEMAQPAAAASDCGE